MRITCVPDQKLDGALFACARGPLDLQGAAELEGSLPRRLTKERPSVVVDMTGVDLMTSAGVGALMAVLNRAQAMGGGLSLFGCNKKVCRVIEVCELQALFNVCATADEARDRLK